MVEMEDGQIRKAVREQYAKIAEQAQGNSCCGPTSNPEMNVSNSCCGPSSTPAANTTTASCCGEMSLPENYSSQLGYSQEEQSSVPQGSNLGLGCGNPTALASIKGGETVVDLGSGAGFDCFLAANKVGETGKIIGVDMTPQMIDTARENATKGDYKNVEFRLGEIENLPVADGEADLIISNCVINLSPNKDKVFQEAYRILKPGGRLMVSDIVLSKELPDDIKNSINAYVGCVSGAILKEDYLKKIEDAGFEDVEIKDSSEATFSSLTIESIKVAATKK
ncbi:MAG: arsenite methyltransferase [Promethearchaeota archaeon]|jgi:ubiquinone/menaquinone biosynthesis C-methylase UbiE